MVRLAADLCALRVHTPQFAQEIGDGAHGGQVVMSSEAWEQLAPSMAAAGWPVVQLLGLYEVCGAVCHPGSLVS